MEHETHTSGQESSPQEGAAVYTCPMHPEVKEPQPGLCPDCGMNLVKSQSSKPKVQKGEHETHDRHKGHSVNIFKAKFWTSLVLTIPVVLISSPVRIVSPEAFPYGEYISFILSSVVFFYGGWIFLASAARELRARLPGMMTLIALAITTAYIWSVYALFAKQGDPLFWELTTLVTVMLLGHWIEMRAVTGAQGALRELSKLLPDTAELINQKSNIKDQKIGDLDLKIVFLDELKVDDLVFVRPGGKIPADGVVVEGASDVNESLMTGESKPVSKTAGSKVIAGATNGDGSLKIKVTEIGEHTFLSGVKRLVAEAQASKSRLQLLSDRAALYLTGIAVTTGVVTLIAWLFVNDDPSFAVERLVAVLVIACPHALGLAIPLVASISTTLAARSGFLVKQRLALEAARNVDIVLFDKTGTLTKGEYGIADVIPNSKFLISKQLPITNDQLLQLAASVDVHSEHFVARAIVEEAKKRGLNLLAVTDFTRLPGKGVRGRVEESEVVVGGEAVLGDVKIQIPADIQSNIAALGGQGKTIIYVLADQKFMGAIALADIIREESSQAIADLKTLGVKVAMVTGDSEDVAGWVARELAMDEYFAKVLPHEKSEKVKLLQGRGMKVAMVGDGINDAPALTQADLGIAIGAGTNVAIESAGIILVRNDPRDIVKIIRLSRLTYRKMIQNLFWATGYNVVALPLAAGVLVSQGILLNPAVAAVLMSVSTVVVAINAVLLKNARLS